MYAPPDEARFGTLAEARAEARRRLGVTRLHPSRKGGLPDEEGLRAVECWNTLTAAEYRRTGRELGGVAIYKEAAEP